VRDASSAQEILMQSTSLFLRVTTCLALGVLTSAAGADDFADFGRFGRTASQAKPLVIGHRGASGFVPEHTLTSYFIAIQQGADFVEPDLVITKDGVLVARHENEISTTTDVSERPEFAARRTTKIIDGVSLTGWFTEDFTLRELKTLRAKERIPAIRPDNTRFDGQFPVPTLDEVLELVESVNKDRAASARRQGRPAPAPIGVYPETKHPSFFDGIGLSLEEPLVRSLNRFGYDSKRDPVFIQSFETGNLRKLNRMTRVSLVQLIDAAGKPFDFVLNGDPRTYADLVTPRGLAEIATYADGIGPNKLLVIPRNPDGTLRTATRLVDTAHFFGLVVHPFTFRAENAFLPTEFRFGSDPTVSGNLIGEMLPYLATGIDGFFIDQPDVGVQSRAAAKAKN
jgi:glycerophosphoryl diester phosphodiesterase